MEYNPLNIKYVVNITSSVRVNEIIIAAANDIFRGLIIFTTIITIHK